MLSDEIKLCPLEQKISGKRAMNMKSADLHAMGILYGDAMDIVEAVKEIMVSFMFSLFFQG